MGAIKEGSQLKGELQSYLAVGPLGQDNVWTAVGDDGKVVIVKAPTADDSPAASYPQFCHEMTMHELFKSSDGIRKQVDRIPPVLNSGAPPMLVLEIFETTLWQARSKRPFSKDEIKAVCRGILHGLQQVHGKGLVYADLKMPNVMISGFNVGAPGDGSALVAKLGDLGIVMPPCNGKVQPVAYRAPEIYFKGEIAPPADIWAFGLVCCHLLEAQNRFSKTGLYDDLNTGGGSMPEREQAMRYAIADDYDIKNVDYYKGCSLPYQHEDHPTGNQWSELRKRGLDEQDVEFLQWVLQSDPTKRPTASAILKSSWINTGTTSSSHISTVDGPADTKASSPQKTPTKRTSPRKSAGPVSQPTRVISNSSQMTAPIAVAQNTAPTVPTSSAVPQGLSAILSGLPGGAAASSISTNNAPSYPNETNPLIHQRESSDSPSNVPTSHKREISDGSKRPRLSDDIANITKESPAIPNNAMSHLQSTPVGGPAASGGTYLSYR